MEIVVQKKEKARSLRYKPTTPLNVVSKTIGTELSYPMTMKNLSHSGFLLTWSNPRLIPFQENTLLEIVIDPEKSVLDEPLSCLAKVVRRQASHTQAATDFGVHIVQIDEMDKKAWEDCLASLVSKGNFLPIEASSRGAAKPAV